MVEFCDKYNIKLGHSTTYYLQGNDLAESSNKSLINIIKKIMKANKNNWHKNIVNALWEDRVSSNKSIRMSPFQLVYGIDTVISYITFNPSYEIIVGSRKWGEWCTTLDQSDDPYLAEESWGI